MAQSCTRYYPADECLSLGGKLLLVALLSGCAANASDSQVRLVDVQLPSGEMKRDVLVLAEEDTVTSSVKVICRTWQHAELKVSRRRYPARSEEFCGSPAFWASRQAAPRWIHIESGSANLPDDERKCRIKADRWGSRSHRGLKNTTYETVYNSCMEGKGYSLFTID